MPQAICGGFPTEWRDMGQGPRRAVLLHCSLAHSGAWTGVADRLGRTLSMRAFDLPGHGRSGAWPPGTRGDLHDTATAQARAIAQDFGQGGPVDLIGHSFGATVALRVAVESPELVRSLSLFEPVYFAVARADRPEVYAEDRVQHEEFTAAFAAGDMEGAARAFMAIWGDGRPWEALPESQRRALAGQIHLIDYGYPTIYEDRPGLVASGALSRLRLPVLLLEGSASPGSIAAINDGLAARIEGAERAVVAGAGHMGPITHPEQVAREIAGFLDTVPA